MAEIEGQPEQRRSFTDEFKREAVRLAVERGNVSAVARDLGINESVLNRWKRGLQEEAEIPGSGTRPWFGHSALVRALGPFPARAIRAIRAIRATQAMRS